MKTNPLRDVQIMGIVNLTDDSFFAGSRSLGDDGRPDLDLLDGRIRKMLSDGADILDFGACSSRPGSEPVSEDVEWKRLEPALRSVALSFPCTRLSIDTFRPSIVEKAYGIIGPFIVNDVSGGCEKMWSTIAGLSLPYISMHTRGTPMNMQSLTDYDDVTAAVRTFFIRFAEQADKYGIKDWILDPGFGFAKTIKQNWQLLRELSAFQEFGRPILAGLSRKSFLYKPLGISQDDALDATQIADFAALQQGADILRVHDAAPARQTLEIYRLLEA